MSRLLELLVITMEECGELTQACSKVIRYGDTGNNIQRLESEIGDLICMVELLKEEGVITSLAIEEARESKLQKLKTYSNLFEGD